jgi:AbrB family looped-hinge helix DNA binding protein
MHHHRNMLQIQTKLTSHGQVSVPAAVRQSLSLTPGSVLVWTEEDGRIMVERAVRHSTDAVHQALFADSATTGSPAKTLTELKQGIRQHMQRRHAGR